MHSAGANQHLCNVDCMANISAVWAAWNCTNMRGMPAAHHQRTMQAARPAAAGHQVTHTTAANYLACNMHTHVPCTLLQSRLPRSHTLPWLQHTTTCLVCCHKVGCREADLEVHLASTQEKDIWPQLRNPAHTQAAKKTEGRDAPTHRWPPASTTGRPRVAKLPGGMRGGASVRRLVAGAAAADGRLQQMRSKRRWVREPAMPGLCSRHADQPGPAFPGGHAGKGKSVRCWLASGSLLARFWLTMAAAATKTCPDHTALQAQPQIQPVRQQRAIHLWLITMGSCSNQYMPEPHPLIQPVRQQTKPPTCGSSRWAAAS